MTLLCDISENGIQNSFFSPKYLLRICFFFLLNLVLKIGSLRRCAHSNPRAWPGEWPCLSCYGLRMVMLKQGGAVGPRSHAITLKRKDLGV